MKWGMDAARVELPPWVDVSGSERVRSGWGAGRESDFVVWGLTLGMIADMLAVAEYVAFRFGTPSRSLSHRCSQEESSRVPTGSTANAWVCAVWVRQRRAAATGERTLSEEARCTTRRATFRSPGALPEKSLRLASNPTVPEFCLFAERG